MAAERTFSERVPELIQRIRAAEEAEARKQPIRVRLDINMPIGTKRRLKIASKRHSVTQTQIILGLLEEHLPKLLGTENLTLFADETECDQS